MQKNASNPPYFLLQGKPTLLPRLPELLTYQNNSIITRFCHDHPEHTPEQAQQIFQDLLSWLWLSEHRSTRQLTTHMIAPLSTLDNMWHVFILHTKDYTTFCNNFFNRYLHHEVEPLGQEFTLSTDELSEFLADCYDQLGEGWLLRNFDLE